MDRRGGIFKQGDEQTSGEHEQPKLCAFHEIFRPMSVEGGEERGVFLC
jgi:hypothetical protein